VDFIAGCLGGFLGATGAFVAGSHRAIEFLRAWARGRHDSPPPPAAASVAIIAALGVFETEPELRTRLWRNIGFVRDGLRARGFDIGDVESALIPIRVGDEERMMTLKRLLLERGLYTAHLGAPLVEPAGCRLRLTVKCDQSHEELARALDIMEGAGRDFGLVG
jgi:glycine C-acetyltransferase